MVQIISNQIDPNHTASGITAGCIKGGQPVHAIGIKVDPCVSQDAARDPGSRNGLRAIPADKKVRVWDDSQRRGCDPAILDQKEHTIGSAVRLRKVLSCIDDDTKTVADSIKITAGETCRDIVVTPLAEVSITYVGVP